MQSVHTPLSVLQWGRVFYDAETKEDVQMADKKVALQWGRVFYDAET